MRKPPEAWPVMTSHSTWARFAKVRGANQFTKRSKNIDCKIEKTSSAKLDGGTEKHKDYFVTQWSLQLPATRQKSSRHLLLGAIPYHAVFPLFLANVFFGTFQGASAIQDATRPFWEHEKTFFADWKDVDIRAPHFEIYQMAMHSSQEAHAHTSLWMSRSAAAVEWCRRWIQRQFYDWCCHDVFTCMKSAEASLTGIFTYFVDGRYL